MSDWEEKLKRLERRNAELRQRLAEGARGTADRATADRATADRGTGGRAARPRSRVTQLETTHIIGRVPATPPTAADARRVPERGERREPPGRLDDERLMRAPPGTLSGAERHRRARVFSQRGAPAPLSRMGPDQLTAESLSDFSGQRSEAELRSATERVRGTENRYGSRRAERASGAGFWSGVTELIDRLGNPPRRSSEPRRPLLPLVDPARLYEEDVEGRPARASSLAPVDPARLFEEDVEARVARASRRPLVDPARLYREGDVETLARADADRHWDVNRNLEGAAESGIPIFFEYVGGFTEDYEFDPDYLIAYHERLERNAENAPLHMTVGGGGVRALTSFLWRLFPRLQGWQGVRRLVGTYRAGGSPHPRGHHIFAKAAFPREHWNRMFSISPEAMARLGLDHRAMSTVQNRLFRALARSGRPNTIQEHIQIALAALQAGGASRPQARWLVAQALRNLRQLGAGRVARPIRIPYQ